MYIVNRQMRTLTFNYDWLRITNCKTKALKSIFMISFWHLWSFKIKKVLLKYHSAELFLFSQNNTEFFDQSPCYARIQTYLNLLVPTNFVLLVSQSSYASFLFLPKIILNASRPLLTLWFPVNMLRLTKTFNWSLHSKPSILSSRPLKPISHLHTHPKKKQKKKNKKQKTTSE